MKLWRVKYPSTAAETYRDDKSHSPFPKQSHPVNLQIDPASLQISTAGYSWESTDAIWLPSSHTIEHPKEWTQCYFRFVLNNDQRKQKSKCNSKKNQSQQLWMNSDTSLQGKILLCFLTFPSVCGPVYPKWSTGICWLSIWNKET